MKKTILTLALVAATAAAFAQGKVQMANNGATAITFDANPLTQDAALANQGVPTTGPLPSGITLVCGLYAGTSSTSLSLYTTVVINPAAGTGQAPGVISPTRATLPWGAVLTFMEVKVWNNAFADYDAASGSYRGSTAMFTMTPGTSIAYPNTYNGGGTTYAQVPLIVSVPEPSTFALAGLGAAALMIFRRRS